MTAELRTLIREAIDERKRNALQAFIDSGEIGVCSSCGCAHDCFTVGCTRCGDRRRKREHQHDPAYREKWARWRRVKRAEAKTA